MGAATIKMTINTNMTSTSGVMLTELFNVPRRLERWGMG
jgi:hypothetical protein